MIPLTHGILQQKQAPSTYLSVDDDYITHSYISGTSTFNIIASGAWTLTEVGKVLWITESPTSGTGNTLVTVTFTANSGAVRGGQLLITMGALTVDVFVWQDAYPV